jgi:hypothetical protein
VPFDQMAAMHRAAPHSRTVALAPGPEHWIHAGVSEQSLAHSLTVERRFLAGHAVPPS